MLDFIKRKEKCCGCHACYNICPVQAIEMQADEEGFLYPILIADKCIQCNQCELVCPIIHKPEKLPLQLVYGCYANRIEEQRSSSSGGVFSVLARAVLSVNGIVCGAAFDEEQAVYHLIVNSEDTLYRLKETKYVQSKLGNIFKDIRKALSLNRIVLFSGTPCQVAGLKGYLGKEYDNLLCIDLICHGVPSPEVWEKYVREISKGKKVKRVMFRNKNKGISNVTLDYYLQDGTIIREKYSESLYIKGFMQNLFIRPSCFECQFKGVKRCSDLTIGDFWAAKEYHPNFYNDNGVSAVIIHSKKGKLWFEKVNKNLKIIESTPKEVVCWNEHLCVSAFPNEKRKVFFVNWKEKNLKELLNMLTQNYEKEEVLINIHIIKKRVKNSLLKTIKRIKKWLV